MSKLKALWLLLFSERFYLYADGYRMANNMYTNELKNIIDDIDDIIDTANLQAGNLKVVEEILENN